MSLSTSARLSTALPLHPPSVNEEQAQFEARTADMETFFSQPRFAAIKRPYSAASVVAKQGSMPVIPLPSSLMSDKLFSLLTKAAEEKQPVHTLGAVDPVQMTQMARHQEVVYISGWAASSLLTTGNNEVGPDFGYKLHCVALVISFLNHVLLEITHILPFQTKFIASSEPSNCMIKRTMINACRHLQKSGHLWRILIIYAQLLLMPIQGELVILYTEISVLAQDAV
jgi:hypothetical protein